MNLRLPLTSTPHYVLKYNDDGNLTRNLLTVDDVPSISNHTHDVTNINNF